MTKETRNALLIISFGSSYGGARKTLERVEAYIGSRYPQHDCFAAFTSRRIIKKLKERDGICIDTPGEALEKIRSQGYTHVICQSLHVISGIEYEKTREEAANFRDAFKSISLGKPLLSGDADYEYIADWLSKLAQKYGSLLLMGHGSAHQSNAAYSKLESCLRNRGINKVFIATVEGRPVLADAIDKMEQAGVKEVTLMPFMVVAGDHARNDMAGDHENSWKSILTSQGFKVEIQMNGLGDYDTVAEIFYRHACISSFRILQSQPK